MDRRMFLKTAGKGVALVGGALAFPSILLGNPNPSNLEEYCFTISPHKSIALRAVDTTPEKFLRDNPTVEAAINGPYYDAENRTEGVAYLANDWHLATGKPDDIRGYLSVSRKGDEIKVAESLSGKLEDYFLVLGTHPLLVTDGKVHSQSREQRYRERIAYRSAIGTKSGSDMCFAVSADEILMSEWAQRLDEVGYYGALNLDGGPISQMALRDDGISVKGKGTGNTKLVIFSYTR